MRKDRAYEIKIMVKENIDVFHQYNAVSELKIHGLVHDDLLELALNPLSTIRLTVKETVRQCLMAR